MFGSLLNVMFPGFSLISAVAELSSYYKRVFWCTWTIRVQKHDFGCLQISQRPDLSGAVRQNSVGVELLRGSWQRLSLDFCFQKLICCFPGTTRGSAAEQQRSSGAATTGTFADLGNLLLKSWRKRSEIVLISDQSGWSAVPE